KKHPQKHHQKSHPFDGVLPYLTLSQHFTHKKIATANQRDGSFGLFWSVLTELLFTTTNCHHTNSQIISREKHSDRKNRPFGLWWVDFWGFFGRFIKK
ncbi:MAG: hypothetical protein SPH19_08905, partial [Sodaliphilus sp.]|nr:hypothetical protein [Sodaliphilus sp.]